jgi:hypothetical protein
LWAGEDSRTGAGATCYTLKRQDEEYFGGHREEVLARDGYRCRIPGCGKSGSGKRPLAVHHREPGNNDPNLMITLCLAHHAMVTRTQMLCKEWPELLRVPGREQHPEAQEQIPELAELFVLKSRTETDARKKDSVIFVLKSPTNFSRNFVRVLRANSPGFRVP